MTVDFHVHSTASDGTCPPAELVARSAGFAAIAITDHDNVDGVAEFLEVGDDATRRGRRVHVDGATRRGRRVHVDDATWPLRVAGVELSIEPGAGFDKFHLLGLGVDPHDAGLKAFLKRVLDGRNARNERILANFARLGIEIAADDIAGYAHGDVLARPHFANWLVAHGRAKDSAEAFATYLLPDSPAATRCYEERWHPPQEEAFRVIHAAGGLAVMAHPKYWRRAWKTEGPDYAAAARELARLKEAGLDGLEALYAANAPAENVGFVRIATRLGLLKSAGSDFHGTNKPAIALGMTVDGDYIAPLLEALKERESKG